MWIAPVWQVVDEINAGLPADTWENVPDRRLDQSWSLSLRSAEAAAVTMSQRTKCSLERKTKTVIDETLLTRVTVNPEIFGGKPIIRGMRITLKDSLRQLIEKCLEADPVDPALLRN